MNQELLHAFLPSIVATHFHLVEFKQIIDPTTNAVCSELFMDEKNSFGMPSCSPGFKKAFFKTFCKELLLKRSCLIKNPWVEAVSNSTKITLLTLLPVLL
tara:strand:+ start:129 stop:428 length:300 start_codon:yes stop_codon:yes gene_type:complete